MDNLPAVAAKPRTPMAFAAAMLSELCDRIDEGVDITDSVVALFKEVHLEHADAVDRRISFDLWITGAIKTAKEARDGYADRARKLEQAHKVFKEKTAEIVIEFPEIPFKGALGRLAVQLNPPSLSLGFGSKELTQEIIEMFGIDREYIKTVTTLVLDTVAVKAALQNGKTFPWAKLEQGSSLRIKK